VLQNGTRRTAAEPGVSVRVVQVGVPGRAVRRRDVAGARKSPWQARQFVASLFADHCS